MDLPDHIELAIKDFDRLTEKVDYESIQELIQWTADAVNLQRRILAEVSVCEGQIVALPAVQVAEMLERHAQRLMVLTMMVAKAYKALGVKTDFVAPCLEPASIHTTQAVLSDNKETKQWQN